MTFFRDDKPGTSTAKIRAGIPVISEALLSLGRGGRLFRHFRTDRLPPPGRRRSSANADPEMSEGFGGGAADEDLLAVKGAHLPMERTGAGRGEGADLAPFDGGGRTG